MDGQTDGRTTLSLCLSTPVHRQKWYQDDRTLCWVNLLLKQQNTKFHGSIDATSSWTCMHYHTWRYHRMFWCSQLSAQSYNEYSHHEHGRGISTCFWVPQPVSEHLADVLHQIPATECPWRNYQRCMPMSMRALPMVHAVIFHHIPPPLECS